MMRKNSKYLRNHEKTIHNEQTTSVISLVPDGGNIKSLPPKYWEIRKYNKAFQRMTMLAASIAIKGLPMLHLEDKVSFALQCMEDFDVQHLVVVKEDYFIGLVSKSDLLDTDESFGEVNIDNIKAVYF